MTIRTALISSILALAIVGTFGFFVFRDDPIQNKGAVVAKTPFRYEIADSPAEREQGLSGRTDVPADYGLLFVFPKKGRYGFWMKDMLVSIDMIWLADDGTILAIDEAVSPSTYPTPFYPPGEVSLVLETRAGEARTQGWNVGTKIPLPSL